MALTLREEHYPFWSAGRLESVLRADNLARSSKSPVPGSVDVFDKADQTDASRKKDTLAKDTALDNLLVGKLTNIGLPLRPASKVKFYFDDGEMDDMWLAITWGKAT